MQFSNRLRDLLQRNLYDEVKSENPFCVLVKGDLKIMLFGSKEYAESNHPLLRLETTDIEAVHNKIKSKFWNSDNYGDWRFELPVVHVTSPHATSAQLSASKN